MEKQALRVEEAADVLGIGRSAAYSAVKRGEIPSIRIGGLLLVPKPALERMLLEARVSRKEERYDADAGDSG